MEVTPLDGPAFESTPGLGLKLSSPHVLQRWLLCACNQNGLVLVSLRIWLSLLSSCMSLFAGVLLIYSRTWCFSRLMCRPSPTLGQHVLTLSVLCFGGSFSPNNWRLAVAKPRQN